MSEQWLPIPGYEGRYLVSDQGRVRSLVTNRILAQARELGRPYRYVTLRRDGRQSHRRVHALVLEAFVGPRPAGAFGLHGDDNVSNNTLPNLRWGSRSDNAADMIRNGRHNNARKTHCKWGHELAGDNLRVVRKSRVCRACADRRRAEYEARQAALADITPVPSSAAGSPAAAEEATTREEVLFP